MTHTATRRIQNSYLRSSSLRDKGARVHDTNSVCYFNGVSVVLEYVETRTHVVPGFSDSDLSLTKKSAPYIYWHSADWWRMMSCFLPLFLFLRFLKHWKPTAGLPGWWFKSIYWFKHGHKQNHRWAASVLSMILAPFVAVSLNVIR